MHQIDIFKSGIKVSPEPILIHVSDPNLVKVENLQRESRVEQIFSFNIDASCAGEGFIRVNIRGMLFLLFFNKQITLFAFSIIKSLSKYIELNTKN